MDPVDEELEDNGENILSFIQLKYCTVCHLETPIRAKHCKKCDRCIGTHDHHCPWVGNCIGERNKVKFYVYLWIQMIQLVLGATLATLLLVKILNKNDIGKKDRFFAVFTGIETLVCALLGLFVGVLLFLHTYLIS